MGSCFSYCKGEVNRCQGFIFCTRHKGNKYFDTGSLLEFENLIGVDEQTECKEPISLFTVRERELLSAGKFDVLLNEQEKQHAEIEEQQVRQEEELELEEEAAMEARREAARISRLVQSPEIINPAKLVFNCNSSNWMRGNVTMTEIPVHQPPYKRLEKGTSALQGHTTSNHQLRERMCTVNSTPPSSLDLEWENEEGLTPPTHATSVTDDDLTSMAITSTPSNLSHRSSPLSNGNDLEWDGDFTSAQMTDLDLETEQLISEIERMTSVALNETGGTR